MGYAVAVCRSVYGAVVMHSLPITFSKLLLLGLVCWRGGAIYYVRPNGTDQAEGTNSKTAFRTMQRAAQALNHGDLVVLAPGTCVLE